MKYRVTCAWTPTLVGDGQKLAPIDYMVWKRPRQCARSAGGSIFRLLSSGARALEGYLTQLKTADKLDFGFLGRLRTEFRGAGGFLLNTPVRFPCLGTQRIRKICSFRPLPLRPRALTCPRRRSREPCEPALYSRSLERKNVLSELCEPHGRGFSPASPNPTPPRLRMRRWEGTPGNRMRRCGTADSDSVTLRGNEDLPAADVYHGGTRHRQV